MPVRRLTKTPPPALLASYADQWTAEYVDALAGSRTPGTPWRHPDIVAALRAETHSKCAYCEGIIADVSYPHVEHMLPKSARPELVVDWKNLTLGCQVCNTNKLDYYDEHAPLLQPYLDEPLEHLLFRGPAVLAALGSDRGARTVAKLKLMRSALFLERMKRIQSLHVLLERWGRSQGSDREIFADVVRAELAEDQEFTQTLRSYAASVGFQI